MGQKGDTRGTPTANDLVTTGRLNRIQLAWNRQFAGDTTQQLKDVLEKAESIFDSRQHYTKVMGVLQSSGAGKSRLMDEFSKLSVGICFTLRYGNQTGYPPGDIEVTTLLRDLATGQQNGKRSMEHATSVALLSAAVANSMRSFLCTK